MLLVFMLLRYVWQMKVGSSFERKKQLWERLDMVIQGVP